MAEHRRSLRWRRVAPLMVVAGFVVISAHSRIVSAGPRAGGEAGSHLDRAIEAVFAGEDLAPFVEHGVSVNIHYIGSRRLVTVAMRGEKDLCLLARSSQPGYIEYAALESEPCAANEGADAQVEWSVDSAQAWQ